MLEITEFPDLITKHDDGIASKSIQPIKSIITKVMGFKLVIEKRRKNVRCRHFNVLYLVYVMYIK